MTVSSSGIVNGVIDKKYGKYGTQFLKGVPSRSLPIDVKNAPEGTRFYALFMEDKGAAPVCGFSWIHWLAADISSSALPENIAVSAEFPQGLNSSWSPILGENALTQAESCAFAGCAPPDKPHVYEIHVYALSQSLGLKKGFSLPELFAAMEGKVLAESTLKGTYFN